MNPQFMPPFASQSQSFQVWLKNTVRRKFFTPKALHNIAQGRERSERTLGWRGKQFSTLKGLYNRAICENLRLNTLWHPFRTYE